MPRYWVIAPVQSKRPEVFDTVWQFDLANNLISIGWKQLGDVSKMAREELADAIASTYPHRPAQAKTLIGNMIWAFYHEIAPGDLVIARRGHKLLAAVGNVSGSAYYAPGKWKFPDRAHPDLGFHDHSNFLDVSWQEKPRDRVFPSIVFPMQTLVELSEDKFRGFGEGSASLVAPTAPEELLETAGELEFALEKYLEDFIVSNFDAIFKGELKMYEDAEGNEGQQYPTEIGPIDLLAVEPRSEAFVVIELKKGRPADKVVGQTLRYMGWVKKNLCADGQAVKGLVICREPDPKLTYALEMTRDVTVRYYSVSFKLRETP